MPPCGRRGAGPPLLRTEMERRQTGASHHALLEMGRIMAQKSVQEQGKLLQLWLDPSTCSLVLPCKDLDVPLVWTRAARETSGREVRPHEVPVSHCTDEPQQKHGGHPYWATKLPTTPYPEGPFAVLLWT